MLKGVAKINASRLVHFPFVLISSYSIKILYFIRANDTFSIIFIHTVPSRPFPLPVKEPWDLSRRVSNSLWRGRRCKRLELLQQGVLPAILGDGDPCSDPGD